MTFTEIRTVVMDYCGLTSTDASTRVGKSINRHYRRVTSTIGMNTTRFVTRSVSMTIGQQYATFSEIEKIDRIIDATDSTAIRLLTETTIHNIRSNQPSAGEPIQWAVQNTDADSVVVLFDTVPAVAYSLQADGTTTMSDLSGTDEPIFPESFHDILAWYVISEELLKKEKVPLAREYETRAESLLKELRFSLADSTTYSLQQGQNTSASSTGAGGGGGNTGESIYTQTGLITFDRDPSAPFAVTDTSAYVPNLYAEGVGNVATDRLVGRDTAGTGESEQLTVGGLIEFTGSGGIQVGAFAGGDVTKAAGSFSVFVANDAITFAKMQNVATDSLLGRDAASTGDVENILLNATLSMDGAGNLQRAALTGDVTASAGSNATTIANAAVTLAKMANIATDSLIGRDASGTGVPENILLTAADLAMDGSGNLKLANTAVTPASYTNTNLTVDAKGRITAASNGTAATAYVTLLYASSGTDTNASAATVASIAISGLTANDRIHVMVAHASITQATSAPILYDVTDTTTLCQLTDAGSMTAGQNQSVSAWGMNQQSGITLTSWFSIGRTATAAGTQNNPTIAANWTGSWTLGLRHGGVTSGGTYQYSWAVYKIAGQ